MFVGVRYYKEAPINGYAGNTYTYQTALPLTGGEIVAAPVKNRGTGMMEDKKAMIVDIDLDRPNFPCSEIVSLWPESKKEAENGLREKNT